MKNPDNIRTKIAKLEKEIYTWQREVDKGTCEKEYCDSRIASLREEIEEYKEDLNENDKLKY